MLSEKMKITLEKHSERKNISIVRTEKFCYNSALLWGLV